MDQKVNYASAVRDCCSRWEDKDLQLRVSKIAGDKQPLLWCACVYYCGVHVCVCVCACMCTCVHVCLHVHACLCLFNFGKTDFSLKLNNIITKYTWCAGIQETASVGLQICKEYTEDWIRNFQSTLTYLTERRSGRLLLKIGKHQAQNRSAQVLKEDLDIATEILHCLFEKIQEEEKLPDNCKEGIVIKLPKRT